MKNYYKILGVKEEASEEEIRARWVELAKRYHPDRGEDIASDEKIREINEAYQVLKYSSTRVEYDLNRAYDHGKKEGKRVVNFKRRGVPVSILIILVIIGAVYFKNSQTPSASKLTVPNKIESITRQTQRRIDSADAKDIINSTNPMIQTDEPIQKPLPTPIDVRAKQPQAGTAAPAELVKPNSRTNKPLPAISTRVTIQTDSTNMLDPTTQRLNNVETSIGQLLSDTTGSLTAQAQRFDNVEASITELPNDLMASSFTPAANPINQTNQRKEINPVRPKPDLAQLKFPSSLATEDEVKKFFNNYIDRYNRMDIEGFLSLFSSKAIQNGKDGPERIRKIYTNFFNQGQEVRYNIRNMKIEIYENAVEVKARYEIEQVMKGSGRRRIWKGQARWALIKEGGDLKIFSIDYRNEKTS